MNEYYEMVKEFLAAVDDDAAGYIDVEAAIDALRARYNQANFIVLSDQGDMD